MFCSCNLILHHTPSTLDPLYQEIIIASCDTANILSSNGCVGTTFQIVYVSDFCVVSMFSDFCVVSMSCEFNSLVLTSGFRVRRSYKLSTETVKYSPVSCSDQVRWSCCHCLSYLHVSDVNCRVLLLLW